MINGHGNNLYDYGEKIRADFSSNIAFNNHSSTILEHLKGRLEVITNYPDPTARLLTEKLARHHNLSPEQLLVTNGSAEAFYLVAHLFQHSQTLICTPAFAEYEDACRVFEHQLSFHPLANLNALLRLPDNPSTTENLPRTPSGTQSKSPTGNSFRTLWLGTPNNPNGQLTAPETLQAICREYPNTYLIIDRAYYTLTADPTQRPPLSQPSSTNNYPLTESAQHTSFYAPNLISIHSLTKTFAIPGLRLGYILAAPEIISRLSQMRPPWGVNALALEAGNYILDHYTTLMPAMNELLQESRFLQTSLAQIAGLEIIPSSCNFFLCKLLHLDAKIVKERLIAEYGILIRDCSNFRGLNHSYFRIAAQTRQKNELLILALKNILETSPKPT